MQRQSVAALLLAATTMLLSGATYAQQTPAASTPSATTKSAPAGTTSKNSTAAKTPAKKTGTATKTAAGAPLTTKTQKFSYALGMDIGSKVGPGLKKQDIAVDPALLSQGLKDAMTGGKTRLTEQEAQAVLTEMQAEVTKQRQAKMEKAGAENKIEGDAFLAANKNKPGVVTLPSGLQYKILKEGTGPKPEAADQVSCNYRGTLINGTEFDSSTKRGEAAKFGVSQVIKGWTEALELMSVGSKWQLFIPPSLAYGDRGAGSDIGPNKTLIFEVELVSIEKAKDAKAPAANPDGTSMGTDKAPTDAPTDKSHPPVDKTGTDKKDDTTPQQKQ